MGGLLINVVETLIKSNDRTTAMSYMFAINVGVDGASHNISDKFYDAKRQAEQMIEKNMTADQYAAFQKEEFEEQRRQAIEWERQRAAEEAARIAAEEAEFARLEKEFLTCVELSEDLDLVIENFEEWKDDVDSFGYKLDRAKDDLDARVTRSYIYGGASSSEVARYEADRREYNRMVGTHKEALGELREESRLINRQADHYNNQCIDGKRYKRALIDKHCSGNRSSFCRGFD